MIASYDIPGTRSLGNTVFKNIAQDKLAHAMLLSGADGGAALPFAIEAAGALLCGHPTEEGSCGHCPSCRKVSTFDHPDLFIVLPVNTSKTVKKSAVTADYISHWKKHYSQTPFTSLYEWLQVLEIGNKQGGINVSEVQNIMKFLSLKAYESNHKVVVIWRPELMQNAAANKLLKVLEEPSPGTYFLLVSESLQNLLVTVQSRCQHMVIQKPSDDVLLHFLVKKGLEEDAAGNVVFMADGNINLALNLAFYPNAGEDTDDVHSIFIKWMRDCYAVNFFSCNSFVNDMAKMSREEQKQVLGYGLGVFRDAVSLDSGANDLVRQKGDKLQWTKKFAPFIGAQNITGLYNVFNNGILDLQRNANAKILFMDISLKTMKLLHKKRNDPDPDYHRKV